MAQEETQPGAGTASSEESDSRSQDADEGLDAEWLLPALPLLAARGIRAFSDDGFWAWAATGLLVLALVIGAALIVISVRRRAYGTPICVAAGAIFVGIIAYVRNDFP
ncbi:hypothetical protein [Actinomadura rubrisoli]|uniref:Uncharacterized protein n=1 Tax=Actinomadura rubrisoli TaxID=2530368 RepID=A0A4R5BG88_9ACTN|nr:hypothetical protein [Actinomadura rubrisoli]TDD85628.1 hypothetical protein E1298_18425 [Actinomadura rubrisoli]